MENGDLNDITGVHWSRTTHLTLDAMQGAVDPGRPFLLPSFDNFSREGDNADPAAGEITLSSTYGAAGARLHRLEADIGGPPSPS